MKAIDSVFYARIGRLIKYHRNEKGYSLEKTADLVQTKLGRPFIKQSLSKIEKGKIRIKSDAFKIICQVLDIDTNKKIEIPLNFNSKP